MVFEWSPRAVRQALLACHSYAYGPLWSSAGVVPRSGLFP